LTDRPTKRGDVVWRQALKFDATTNSGFQFPLDSNPEPGQESLSAKPTDLLLIALAGCTGMDVIAILQKKRQPVTGLEVHTHGHQAESPPNVYTDIHIEFVVHGEGVEPAAVERAMELSEEKYCSVSAMLRKTAAITTSYRIEA
jgi:putative redox protein